MEMLFTGTPISAHDALLHGLVSKVVPEERLEAETLAIAQRVCQASRPVVALGKATFQRCRLLIPQPARYFKIIPSPENIWTFLFCSLWRQMAQGRDAAYATASKVMVDNLALRDGQEGIRAFIEKRKPVWSHKTEKAHDWREANASGEITTARICWRPPPDWGGFNHWCGVINFVVDYFLLVGKHAGLFCALYACDKTQWLCLCGLNLHKRFKWTLNGEYMLLSYLCNATENVDW